MPIDCRWGIATIPEREALERRRRRREARAAEGDDWRSFPDRGLMEAHTALHSDMIALLSPSSPHSLRMYRLGVLAGRQEALQEISWLSPEAIAE